VLAGEFVYIKLLLESGTVLIFSRLVWITHTYHVCLLYIIRNMVTLDHCNNTHVCVQLRVVCT